MEATVLYGPRDVRVEEREEPKILKPTDAIIRLSVTCVCGSDLWPYRGIQRIEQPTPMGHEYCGIVEEVGSSVKTVKKGSSSWDRSVSLTIRVRIAELDTNPDARA